MADNQKVQEGDYIEMLVSIAGDNFSLAPNQVLVAGIDIPLELAQAYVSLPEDDPRARIVDPNRAAVLAGADAGHERMRSEVPPPLRVEPASPEVPAGTGDTPPDPGGEPPPPAAIETPEVLVPVFAALYAGEMPALDDEQRAAAIELLGQDPGNELANELRAAIDQTEGEDEVGEKRDTNPSGERATAPEAEKRETTTQKRQGRGKPKPPEDKEPS